MPASISPSNCLNVLQNDIAGVHSPFYWQALCYYYPRGAESPNTQAKGGTLMARLEHDNGKGRTVVEITDIGLVITVLGLVAAGLTGIYLVTRNPETLRQLGEIAMKKSAILTEGGRRILNG